ncbi:hypothetical protein ES703_116573 [subsurface metagenome]
MVTKELRCKSVRIDKLADLAGTNVYHIWKWSPDRNIKIWKVFMCLDLPDTMLGTSWVYVSKGAVDMANPTTSANEEEMLFAMNHITSKAGVPNNVRAFFDFHDKYIEIEDGETVVLSTRQPLDQLIGIGLCIYYTT